MNKIPEDLKKIIADIVSYEKIEEKQRNQMGELEYLYDYNYKYDYNEDDLEENTTIIKIYL